MAIVLTRIDTVPLRRDEFSVEFERWLDTLVDGINSTITQIEEALNSLDVRVTALGG